MIGRCQAGSELISVEQICLDSQLLNTGHFKDRRVGNWEKTNLPNFTMLDTLHIYHFIFSNVNFGPFQIAWSAGIQLVYIYINVSYMKYTQLFLLGKTCIYIRG